MKYRYVFFDMDGTVLDTIGDLTDAINHILKIYGLAPIDERTAADSLGNGARHLVERAFAVSAGQRPTDALVNEALPVYRQYYNAHSQIRTAPYPGILLLMEALKAHGMRLAVVSNKPDQTVQELSEQFFGSLVEFSIGESPTVQRKPAPDTVFEAMRRMGLEQTQNGKFGGFSESVRAQCVYIGDTEVDLKTAENAGMDCIAVTWGFRTEEQLKASGAKRMVFSVEELVQALLGTIS